MSRSVAEHLARCLDDPEFNAAYHALNAEFAAERQHIVIQLAHLYSVEIPPQAVTRQPQWPRPRTYGDSSLGVWAPTYAV